MKDKKIIAIVVVLILLAGVAVFSLTRHKSPPTTNSTQASTGSSSSPSFAPVSTQNLAFSATIASTSSQGAGGTIESDGKGNYHYKATQNGQTSEIVITKDAYYINSNGTWYKYTGSSSSAFDPSTYQYSASQIVALKATSVYKGRQSCPAGTCDTWGVSSGGNSSTIWIDSANKRISKAETVSGGVTSSITYSYKSVSIDIPANAQTIPTP